MNYCENCINNSDEINEACKSCESVFGKISSTPTNYKPKDKSIVFITRDDASSNLAFGSVYDPVQEKTISINNCDTIKLSDKSLSFSFDINTDKIKYFEYIEINGIKYKQICNEEGN